MEVKRKLFYWLDISNFLYIKSKEASVKEEIETEIMAVFDDTGKFDATNFKEKMKASGAEITKDTEDEIVLEKDGYKATIDAKTGEITNYEVIKEATAEDVESGTTAIQIAPTVKSWVSIDIGSCYTNALNYDKTKKSHLMKNSEWGAVAYLTYSQYGRNRNEVSINRCSEYITGMGSGTSSSSYKYSEAEENQRYNGEYGQLASSTGNIYGVYDLRGGASEYVAAFNDQVDSNDCESKYGSSFAAPVNPSTKYATKYSSDNSTPTYEKYYPGDATFEVYTGSNSKAWESDSSYFVSPSISFFRRGGVYNNGANAGVFCAYGSSGYSNNNRSFRVVLPGV